jgi:hypothetical protein
MALEGLQVMNLHDFGPQHNVAMSLLPALLISETDTAPHMIAAPGSKMEFALDAAQHGLYVFPLKLGTKEPLIPNWREVATTDPAQIRACWALCPEANIGVVTPGGFVVGLGSSVLNGDTCSVKALRTPAPAGASLKIADIPAPAPPRESAGPSTKLEWALDAARRGFDVLPIVENTKQPRLPNWQNRATRDPAQITEWFTQYPNDNIGGLTTDKLVIDIDPRNGGKETFAAFKTLSDEIGDELPKTAISNTQGGRYHVIFQLPPHTHVKGGAHKLGKGVDLKSYGGQILLPGSTIDGRAYSRAADFPIAMAPAWLIERGKARKERSDAAGKRIAPDDDAARHAAEQWLDRSAPRAESGERDNVAFKVAARLGDFGCGYDTRLDLMLGWNESHCEPPMEFDDLARVCESAGRNRENAIGKSHPEAGGFEAIDIDETKAPSSEPAIPQTDLIKTSAEFVQGFVPPEYLIDGVLQRRFCYSITAQTGVGKTAIAMLLSSHVEAGRALNGLEVAKGSVLYFAGENPTDIQMRWLGLTQEMKTDPASADVHFMPGAMPLSKIAGRIAAEVAAKELRLALVVVDTAAAYFEGDDENSNTQAVEHARRMRELTKLPGGPCVLILCHPTKRANDDDMIPRGGGAFLAEVDGNIALHKRDCAIVASAQGKFRGREFAPLSFALKTVEHPVLKDVRGRPIPTVVARPISAVEQQRIAVESLSQENQVLKATHGKPDASLAEIAETLGWRFKNGDPARSKVTRYADTLVKAKLLRKHGRRFQITSAGETEIKQLAAVSDAENTCTAVGTEASEMQAQKGGSKGGTKIGTKSVQ